MDGSQAKGFTEWEMVFLTLFLPNKYKSIFGQISFAKIIDTSNFLMFFPTLKENNVRTIKRGNKQDLEGGRERERKKRKQIQNYTSVY